MDFEIYDQIIPPPPEFSDHLEINEFRQNEGESDSGDWTDILVWEDKDPQQDDRDAATPVTPRTLSHLMTLAHSMLTFSNLTRPRKTHWNLLQKRSLNICVYFQYLDSRRQMKSLILTRRDGIRVAEEVESEELDVGERI